MTAPENAPQQYGRPDPDMGRGYGAHCLDWLSRGARWGRGRVSLVTELVFSRPLVFVLKSREVHLKHRPYFCHLWGEGNGIELCIHTWAGFVIVRVELPCYTLSTDNADVEVAGQQRPAARNRLRRDYVSVPCR